MISSKIQTATKIKRINIDVNMSPSQALEYSSLVPSSIGGTSQQLDLQAAVKVCYEVILEKLHSQIVSFVDAGERVFVVAKDVSMQIALHEMLLKSNITKVFLVERNNSIVYAADDTRDIRVVITTPEHSTGFTLTKMHIMLTSVYFGNQNTRTQLEGRINRLGQRADEISIITLHTGILSYIFRKYENARSLSEVLKGFQKEAKVTGGDIMAKPITDIWTPTVELVKDSATSDSKMSGVKRKREKEVVKKEKVTKKRRKVILISSSSSEEGLTFSTSEDEA
jgi:hypothetical protein